MKSIRIFRLVQAIAFILPALIYQLAHSEEFVPQLVQKFQTRTSVLDREMVTFRYEIKNTFEPVNLEDVRGRIYGWPERFLDKNVVTSDLAGPGTYLAIDPAASRSFGGGKPQLYVLTLRKGIRVLNLEETLKSDEQELIKRIHQELQCKTKSAGTETLIAESSMTFFTLRLSSTEACREVAIALVKALNIQAIFYGYSASNSLEDCRYRAAAINVISSQALDFTKSQFFSDEHALGFANTASEVKNIYVASSHDFSLLISSGADLNMPGQLAKMDMADEHVFVKWKKNRIYSCGEKWTPEGSSDVLTAALNVSFKLNYKDTEIESLMLQLKNAFVTKSKGRYFSLSKLLLTGRFNYKASGLPNDEAIFTRWLFLNDNSYNPDFKKELMQMYGTKVAIQDIVAVKEKAETLFKKMTAQQQNSPELMINVFETLGMSRSYALFNVNQMNTYKGGVIISSIDVDKSFAENLQISKVNYKIGLRDCVSKYNDSTLSFEEIQKTDCGIRQ